MTVPGLPEPVRADLFRPFAGSMRRGGTGLGLAIARDLMVAHGGEIESARHQRDRNYVPAHPATGRTGAPTQDSAQNGARVAPAASADVQ